MPISQTTLVNRSTGDRPLRTFRAIIPVQIAVQDTVDRVEFDSTQTALQGMFESYSFNALAVSAAVTAQLSSGGNAILIVLDQPLPVISIRLSTSTAIAENFTLAFHRVDGTAVADKPTTIAPIQNRLAVPPTAFVDGRFAVQLRDALGNPVAIAPANITEVNVQSYPATPRLGILDELTTPNSLLPIWQAAGEIGGSIPAEQGQVNAGAALATALQRYLNAHPELLNRELKLIAESDAPCQFKLNNLTLVPQFIMQRFSADSQSPTSKQVLRFSGKDTTAQNLHLPVPSQGQLTAAMLEISASLRNGAIAANSTSELPNLPLLEAPTGNQGIAIQSRLTVIQPVTLTQPIRINGMALGVMAIAQPTTLHLAIYADQANRPAGKPVAACDLPSLAMGEPNWAIASFPEPIVLFAQPYWISLTAAQGAAFWLTQAGTGNVQVVEDLTQFQLAASSAGLDHLICRYQWLSPSPTSVSTGELTPASALQVRVEGQSIQGVLANGKWCYDLSPALTPLSAARNNIAVAFSTASAGSITVYPPRITFRNSTYSYP